VVVAAPEYLAGQIVVQFDMPNPKEVAESCGLMIHNEPGKK
jgi:sorbitol-specific phosphotransferase system component IIA